MLRRCILVLGLLAGPDGVCPPAGAYPEAPGLVPLAVAPGPVSAISTQATDGLSDTLTFTAGFPGSRDCYLIAPTSTWFHLGRIDWDLSLPANAPSNIQVLVFMKDWDYFWYQRLLPGYAVAGATNSYHVDISPSAGNWTPRGHHAAWSAHTLIAPKEFGIRVFCDTPGEVKCRIDRVAAAPKAPDPAPPFIRDVRPSAAEVRCYDKFEVVFSLPDRYANPFDPDEISVTALIETPDTQTVTVAGFYSRDYYRSVAPTGEEILPQGPPCWKFRYAPLRPGLHRYRIQAGDTRGNAGWGPGSFVALPPERPGYIRVSKTDPRFFEFDNGDSFFPIGHNIRSPSDARLDMQFPWTKRWEEGSSAYARFFDAMRRHGENLAEVWMAAWSLGLEWSPLWRGYHGMGQYNMINAWELDRVFDAADRNGIHLNLVIHNHGKLALRWDNEWVHNPFNVKLGGFLASPDEYFTHPRAIKTYHNLLRYTVARWGYSPRIFAWELWSELDLAGSDNFYRKQECVDWHAMAANALRAMDPNDHLITTHTSGDYTRENTNITVLAQISHISVDAYHGDARPLRIVDLLAETAAYHAAFNKPVMVTEFGGAWNAQGLAHLENSLHAGLWASVCLPLGGAPLFWWWGLIEEENYYPEFLAVSRFMKGEDRRDPALSARTPAVVAPADASNRVQARAMASATRALGWIYDRLACDSPSPDSRPAPANLVLQLDNMTNGAYQVEFWSTSEGVLKERSNVTVTTNRLDVGIPPFVRDVAFKVRKTR